MLALIFAGCGRRESPDRESASEIVVFQMDIQMTQKPEETSAEIESKSMAEQNARANIDATPTVAPKITGNSSMENSTSDPEIDALMDDLESILNELNATINMTDQDALTDATLATLGK